MADVEFKDNSKEVLQALKVAKQNTLTAIGFTAVGHAKRKITDANAIDTGRLRNSIAFATKGRSTPTISYDGKRQKQTTVYTNEEDSVYIGTNVNYAEGIELGTHRKAGAVHFLQDACTNHTAEYKRIAKQALEAIKD